jgi:hypothetical protein
MFYDAVKRHVRHERGPGQYLILSGLVTRHPHSVLVPGAGVPSGHRCVLVDPTAFSLESSFAKEESLCVPPRLLPGIRRVATTPSSITGLLAAPLSSYALPNVEHGTGPCATTMVARWCRSCWATRGRSTSEGDYLGVDFPARPCSSTSITSAAASSAGGGGTAANSGSWWASAIIM